MKNLRFACVTHEGQTHDTNQDRWLADAARGLFLVADGMANDIAPAVAIAELPEVFRDILAGETELTDPELQGQITWMLEILNQRVRAAMRQYGELGLGTTLVLALFRGNRALIAHLGDSRGYLLRNGELEPLTRDHSYLQELVDRGVVSAEEAADASTNGGPNRFLGMFGEAKADIQVLDLRKGDRWLLCSDGLTAMLTDDGIRDILLQAFPPQQLCQNLVDAANAAGGLDNITTLVIEVGEE